MQVYAIDNSNRPSFGMRKFNILSKATKPAKQLTFEEHNELRKSMEKFIREARARQLKAIQSIDEFFKKIIYY